MIIWRSSCRSVTGHPPSVRKIENHFLPANAVTDNSFHEGVRAAALLAEIAFELFADAVHANAQGVRRNAEAVGDLFAMADALAVVASIIIEDQLAALCRQLLKACGQPVEAAFVVQALALALLLLERVGVGVRQRRKRRERREPAFRR